MSEIEIQMSKYYQSLFRFKYNSDFGVYMDKNKIIGIGQKPLKTKGLISFKMGLNLKKYTLKEFLETFKQNKNDIIPITASFGYSYFHINLMLWILDPKCIIIEVPTEEAPLFMNSPESNLEIAISPCIFEEIK